MYTASAAIAISVGIAVGLLLGRDQRFGVAIVGGFSAMIATGLVLSAVYAFVDLGLQVKENKVGSPSQEKRKGEPIIRPARTHHQEIVIKGQLEKISVKQRIMTRIEAGETMEQLIKQFGLNVLNQEYGVQNVANALALDKWAELVDQDLTWFYKIQVESL